MARLNPIHPGEVLLEEFLEPLGISQYRLAKEAGVPARRINEIVHHQRGITADTALRLARFFGTSDLFWLNLQARYDLDVQRTKLGSSLDAIRRHTALPAPSRAVGMTRSAKRRPTETSSRSKRRAK
jgi:antitoxin HigA-1